MPETVTRAFPDKRVQWGMKAGYVTQTDVLIAQGRQQRRPRLPAPYARQLSGDIEILDMNARAIIANFLRGLQGSYLPFYVFEWVPFLFQNNAGGSGRLGVTNYGLNYTIGPGDGTTTLFTLPIGNPGAWPALVSTLQAAYAATIQYPAALVIGTGTYGEDKVQFTVPAAPTIAKITGGGSLSAGAYTIVVTFVVSGVESIASLASNSITASLNDRLSVTAIPLGPAGTTARKIYRTAAGGSIYKLDTTISDNVTTTATLSIADGSLGAIAPPVGAPANNAVIEVDITGRLRIPVHLTSSGNNLTGSGSSSGGDAQVESFVVSGSIYGLRTLDVEEVL